MHSKTCRGCGESKPLDGFCRDQATRDGRSARCKPCRNVRNAQWRANNVEWQKNYYEAYYYENKDRWIARTRTWKRANPHKVAMYDGKRRARTHGVDAELFLYEEVFDRDSWTCGICFEPIPQDARWPDPRSASLDHIVPLSKGGAHTKDNTRCTHLACNVRRGNREE